MIRIAGTGAGAVIQDDVEYETPDFHEGKRVYGKYISNIPLPGPSSNTQTPYNIPDIELVLDMEMVIRLPQGGNPPYFRTMQGFGGVDLFYEFDLNLGNIGVINQSGGDFSPSIGRLWLKYTKSS